MLQLNDSQLGDRQLHHASMPQTGTGGMSSHWHINSILRLSCAAALCQLDNSLSGQRCGGRAQTSLYYHHHTPMDAEWHANSHKNLLPWLLLCMDKLKNDFRVSDRHVADNKWSVNLIKRRILYRREGGRGGALSVIVHFTCSLLGMLELCLKTLNEFALAR